MRRVGESWERGGGAEGGREGSQALGGHAGRGAEVIEGAGVKTKENEAETARERVGLEEDVVRRRCKRLSSVTTTIDSCLTAVEGE